MKFSLCAFLVIFSCFCVTAHAQEMITDNSSKTTFPREISFDYNGKNYQLGATGAATRKKLIIKVYSVASYLQKEAIKPGMDKIQTILSDNYAKQATMKWLRDVDADKVREGFQQSFHKVFPNPNAQLKKDIDNFTQFFNRGAQKNDEFVLRWIPEGHIEVLINGQKTGVVSNKEFALGLWKVWFGENSVVNRDELISLLP